MRCLTVNQLQDKRREILELRNGYPPLNPYGDCLIIIFHNHVLYFFVRVIDTIGFNTCILCVYYKVIIMVTFISAKIPFIF